MQEVAAVSCGRNGQAVGDSVRGIKHVRRLWRSRVLLLLLVLLLMMLVAVMAMMIVVMVVTLTPMVVVVVTTVIMTRSGACSPRWPGSSRRWLVVLLESLRRQYRGRVASSCRSTTANSSTVIVV